MKVEEYHRFTIIMRGYTYEQSEAILKAMKGFENDFVVEITLNTENALQHIEKLNCQFGNEILIGAGTVRTLDDAKHAISAGAKFLLGPHMFSKEMINLARDNNVVSVPAAMTPSEVNEMLSYGADIVKIFPASVLGPRFFTDIQAPLGKIKLMAVGGVSPKNAKDFLESGSQYLGFGSGIFNKEDVKNLDVKNLSNSLKNLLAYV